MNPGLLVKFRPLGPWRPGPDSGARNRVDLIYHSDTLYSAVTGAMASLGRIEEWLDATARAAVPAVRFGSCYPFQGRTSFVTPPRSLWPPSASPRVRWRGARFVPLSLVEDLLAGSPIEEDRWAVDGQSECLIHAGGNGPFRVGVRPAAAVDRLGNGVLRHDTACLEFREGAGLWTVVAFADQAARDKWAGAMKGVFRLLADSGLGGERSRGWGKSAAPEFHEGMLPDLILPQRKAKAKPVVEVAPEPAAEPVAQPAVEISVEVEAVAETPAEVAPEAAAPVETAPMEEAPACTSEPPAENVEAAENFWSVPVAPLMASETAESAPPVAPPATGKVEQAYWLLSLFAPAAGDAINWERGNYGLVTRGGRVNSPAGSGDLKKQLNMVSEGSVLVASDAMCGAALDVAPDGFPHPVFRAGFAVAIPIPSQVAS
jgi:CRISPR type III-A-associated RAMP protein Csm4